MLIIRLYISLTLSMLKRIVVLFFFIQVSYSQTKIEKEALKIHNDARSEVDLAHLVWSEKLKKDAQKYADYLASKDLFEHSNNLKKLNQGENLYYAENYNILENGEKEYYFENTNYLEDASLDWLSEKKDFKYAKIGDSRNNFSLIGHYTQMVWSSTTQVGIAYSKSKSGKVYVVARYHPAGNYWGQYPFKP